MPSNFTENYNLNQWVKSDQVQMEDFNADNAKIDAAVKAVADTVPKIAAGTYAGDGAATRIIELGFTPKAVYVCVKSGIVQSGNNSGGYSYYGGLAVTGAPVVGGGQTVLTITEGGFQVFYHYLEYKYYISTNSVNTTYHYFAIG